MRIFFVEESVTLAEVADLPVIDKGVSGPETEPKFEKFPIRPPTSGHFLSGMTFEVEDIRVKSTKKKA